MNHYSFPDTVKGRHIVFIIDNMAVLFGWYSGYVRNDESASEVLKAVHYLSGIYGTIVQVEHVDRVSTEMAQLADELSRKTGSSIERAVIALGKAEFKPVKSCLIEWLKDPCGKMNLCQELVKEKKTVPS